MSNSGPSSEASPAGRENKRSAFAEMMAAQAKRQKLERAGCRHDASDAFAELMAAARERGAFDEPPAAASSAAAGGSSGDEEEDREGRGVAGASAVETDSAISAQLERFNRSAEHSDEECWSSDDDCDDGDGNDDGNKEDTPEIPEPRTEPALGSSLRGINIHLEKSYQRHIMGFTFIYSDGTAVSAGKIRGTGEVKLTFRTDGDSIVTIRPSYAMHRPKCLEALKFITKKGGHVTVPPPPETGAKFHYFADDDALHVDEGRVLKAIKWDDVNQRIIELETEERKPTDPSNANATVPSLSSLSRKAIELNFVARSRNVEKNAKVAIKRSQLYTDLKVDEIYAEGRLELRQSTEAERVRALRAQLAAAEDKLVRKASTVLERAERRVSKVVWLQRCARDDIRSDLKRERASIQADLKSFRDTLESTYQLASNTDGNKGDETVICTSPSCRKFFDWTRVQARKRCVVPGCSERSPSCGCNVKACNRCNDAFCERHVKQHEEGCAIEAESKCGWREDDGRILPVMCGRVLGDNDLKKKCFYCEAVCCSDCYDTCSGYDSEWGRTCGKVWCKQCLERCSGVGEACCSDCSFHDDLWV